MASFSNIIPASTAFPKNAATIFAITLFPNLRGLAVQIFSHIRIPFSEFQTSSVHTVYLIINRHPIQFFFIALPAALLCLLQSFLIIWIHSLLLFMYIHSSRQNPWTPPADKHESEIKYRKTPDNMLYFLCFSPIPGNREEVSMWNFLYLF